MTKHLAGNTRYNGGPQSLGIFPSVLLILAETAVSQAGSVIERARRGG